MNPHEDWRPLAEAVKDWPRCANCGDPYGNVYFGASHWCEDGYTPDGEDVARKMRAEA